MGDYIKKPSVYTVLRIILIVLLVAFAAVAIIKNVDLMIGLAVIFGIIIAGSVLNTVENYLKSDKKNFIYTLIVSVALSAYFILFLLKLMLKF